MFRLFRHWVPTPGTPQRPEVKARRSVAKPVGLGVPDVCFRLVSDMAQVSGPDFGPAIEESGVEPKVQQLYGTSQSGRRRLRIGPVFRGLSRFPRPPKPGADVQASGFWQRSPTRKMLGDVANMSQV